MQEFAKEAYGHIIAMLIFLGIVIIFSPIVTFLPNLFLGK